METLPLSLLAVGNGSFAERLKGKIVTPAVEGARHFRPPGGLGETRYEGCAVAVFSDDISAQVEASRKSAQRVQTIAGFAVAVFEEKLEDDIWTTFVALPAKNVVAVATDAASLQTVLTRRKGVPGSKALPASLPEWKYVNTGALLWGVRHYDRTQELDPTSPFQGQAAANIPDATAVGTALQVDRGPLTRMPAHSRRAS